ncbi:helicase domino-like isoform X2 [Ornithodoros turicata]|uniref:helicase domino-like isoform X2 n=1 Tax=Ornithodoros turicata TaxID=34597 RepID=UPI003138E6D6
MIQVGSGESNGEQQGNEHEPLQSTTPAVASLLQSTQGSGDLLSQPARVRQVRNVVAAEEVVAQPAVSVVTTVATSSYQHYLIPGVSIGGQIQNVTIPAQVAVSMHEQQSPGGGEGVSSPTSLGSPQNLARILAVATQGYGARSPAPAKISQAQGPSPRPTARLTPAALLATTQPAAQQQAIVMDSLHSYSLPSGASSHVVVPPRTVYHPQGTQKVTTVQSSGQPTGHFAVPKRTLSSSSGVAVKGAGGGGVPVSGAESARAAKRPKLEARPPATEEVAAMRQKIHDYRIQELRKNKERYVEHLAELYFLQNGGNMMDFMAWKRRPSPQLVALLRANALDSEDEEDPLQFLNVRSAETAAQSAATSASVASGAADATAVPQGQTVGATPAAAPPSPPPTSIKGPSLSPSSHSQSVQSTPPRPRTPGSPVGSPTRPPHGSPSRVRPTPSPALVLPAGRLSTRQHSISAVYDSSIGSQEEIVERAKQEAYVMQRIAELRKEGMWTAKRLPKVQEPPRAKAHWDYLLEEMVWLATDFAQERKWKKAAAKKCARMMMKYHQEREQKAERAEKEELQRLRKIAGQVAKEIKLFWTNIEKLVEYKQQARLDEKRKKALDLHLNFIMDQTEKYSTWLREGMAGQATAAAPPSTSQPASPARSGSSNDEDFEPDASGSDDEETIDREETAASISSEDQKKELELLQQESELPLEQLLPPEILEKPASPLPPQGGEEDSENDASSSSREAGEEDDEEEEQKSKASNDSRTDKKHDIKVEDDEEFQMEEDEGDDEATMEEQEEVEGNVDYTAEIQELQEEGELSLEMLYEKYGGAYTSDFEVPNSPASDEDDASDDEHADDNDGGGSSDENSEDEDEDMEDEEEEDEEMEDSSDSEVQDIGVEYLIHPEVEEGSAEVKEEKKDGETCKGPTKEITDIAATAQSLQPKGNTLSTTQVCTKIPWLLKHTMREYQHIGLDWLVTLHAKKLNGILADEMGLGKTIQTISLLAHLACEKGVWGPHLIVVPTSVMLNWEMEFKKWCPAFKILTYYGIPKERKQKRQGWTKPNAFHVCITSYKLVVQDHQAFRRKKWKYLILDEAQHIKNFKSQRWQMLLNFQTSRRLLLTGTPLQNSLMELWSLMHFLMPNVFQSHREFREWFVNPVTGMIEGNNEYNESLIKRLHKVLRPFLLRRLKCEVEKQLPKKYEHVVLCRLSTRQRYLYDDFMSQTKTKETLATGSFMSVINILMQLRKVCNHPNMFEPRPIMSPFRMEGLVYYTASCVYDICKYNPFKHVSLSALNLLLADVELCLTAFAAHRIKKFQTPCHYIESIDSHPRPPPRCPPGKIRLHIRTSATPSAASQARGSTAAAGAGQAYSTARLVSAHQGAGGVVVRPAVGSASFALARAGAVGQQQQQRLVVVSTPGSAPSSRAQSPIAQVAPGQATSGSGGEYMLQLVQKSNTVAGSGAVVGSPITVQIQQSGHGSPRLSVPLGIGRIVQTTSGQHLLLTPAAAADGTGPSGQPQLQQQQAVVCQPQVARQLVSQTSHSTAATGARVTVAMAPSTTAQPVTKVVSSSANGTPVQQGPGNKPMVRVAPLTVGNASKNALNAKTPSGTKVAATHHHFSRQLPGSTDPKSPFYMDSLENRRRQRHREKLRLLGRTNALRCAACPTYGRDLVEAVTVVQDVRPPTKGRAWGGAGYVHCLHAPVEQPARYWPHNTQALSDLVHTPPILLERLRDIVSRFVFAVPGVMASPIQMHVSHPPPSALNGERVLQQRLHEELSHRCAFLHPIASNLQTQFPELRLIQYDCGKLQVLDKLLWQLRSGAHRVLIFTQMTRMLDILEQFLNYHGHTYLRLDGNTRVDQRQALMERFNADKRIFCFILSTRSGGIGVNLTGADTVIFYDSDWNPTMDAQAQDRCHRIGQTRDVHIYRLISERTVEENILKKANQKRLLGDLAIEGGNFTTAFFKRNAIKDLFGVEFDLSAVENKDDLLKEEKAEAEKFTPMEFEKALGMAEEELDVQAATTARAEAAAELAEFDESIPLDTDSRDNEDKSQAEEELDKLMDQLTPVEKYAMQFLESLQEPLTLEQLKQAEEEIEAQKKDWELGRLKAIKEEEERRAGTLEDEDGPQLVYSREDAYTQVFVSMNNHEQMPIWAPPTPPQDENDLYIDYSTGFLYEPSVMPESSLPAVYIKREEKRLKADHISTAASRKQKARKEDAVHIPKSLFDRPTAAILKMRREAKMQKVKSLIVSGPSGTIGGSLSLPTARQAATSGFVGARPIVDVCQDTPEWLIHEDWAVLQVIQQLQDIPLSLTVLSPGHTPNWDLVSDVVNSVSRIFRSPKQAKDRYESVIVPREEGKILYDTNPKKQKKTKGIYKTKNNRAMRTGQLFQQDGNQSFTTLYNTRFETIRAVASKRTPTLKPLFTNPTAKNPKHAAVLSENGINYEQPLNPVKLATIRAERIAREKQKTQVAAEAQRQQVQAMQAGQTPAIATAGAAPTATVLAPQQVTTQAVLATLSQSQQQQLQAATGQLAVTTVSLAKTLGSGILVSTAGSTAAPTFAVTKVPVTAVASLTPATLRVQQRPQAAAPGATTVQEMVAAAAAGRTLTAAQTVAAIATATTTTAVASGATIPAVVSVTGLSPAQLQAAAATQRISAVAAVGQVSAAQAGAAVAAGRNLTPSQLQAIRQASFIRQQQQQQQQQRLQEQLKQQQQLKRIQQAQQQASAVTVATAASPVVTAATTAKVAVSVALTPAQQRAVQQHAAVAGGSKQPVAKQAIARTLTEAEMAQLMKRQQFQQKQQLQAAHLLAQAQHQQQQITQQALTGAVQTPVATLVKTVSAPSSLGASSSSVTIPVSAVTMAGVNINVSMPQAKIGATSKPATGGSVTSQQMQMRQLQIQQHILQQQQRKVQLQAQQKVAGLTQAQMQAKGTSSVATQLGTVQIVQQGAGQPGKAALPSATAIVQQIIKQVVPVNQNFVVSGAGPATASAGTAVTVSSPASPAAQVHAMLQKSQQHGATVALASTTSTATLVPTRIMTLGAAAPTVQGQAVTLKQGLQAVQPPDAPGKRGGGTPSTSESRL